MKDSLEKRCYFGCYVNQRIDQQTTPVFVFYARAKDVRQWVGIRRVEENPAEGTQRILREGRTKAIKRFLEADPRNTIPNNILLAFQPGNTKLTLLDNKVASLLPEEVDEKIDYHNGCGESLKWGILEFSFKPNEKETLRPALVVDGQHRLYGISDFQNEDLPLLIVSLVDASIEEQAFQFIVINNKAVRVPTDNVKSIVANFNENELRDRLLKSGVRYGKESPILRDIDNLPNSPFQYLLDWPSNQSGMKLVSLTAIEQALRNIRTFFSFLNEDKDDDSIMAIFFAMWRAIKDTYPSLWGKDNQFMKKVNINAVNEFTTDRLKKAWEFGLVDILQPESIEQQVKNIFSKIPEDFWQKKWNITIQDNANVRQMIKDDLETQITNRKMGNDWYDGLQLIEVND